MTPLQRRIYAMTRDRICWPSVTVSILWLFCLAGLVLQITGHTTEAADRRSLQVVANRPDTPSEIVSTANALVMLYSELADKVSVQQAVGASGPTLHVSDF